MDKIESNNKVINKMIWSLLPAQLLVAFINAIGSAVTGLIIGNNFSNESLAILGFIGPLNTTIASFNLLISCGARILFGKALGKGNRSKQNSVYTTSIILCLLFGSVLSFVCQVFTTPVSRILRASDDVLQLLNGYIRGLSIGFIPTLLVTCLVSFLQLLNQSTYTLFCIFLLGILNIVFGLLNIRVFGLGLFGVGLSSSLSQLIVMFMLFIKLKSMEKPVRFDFSDFNGKSCKEIITIGIPNGAIRIIYAFRNIWINALILKIGGLKEVQSYGILVSSSGLFEIVNVGVPVVGAMLFSVYYGIKDSFTLRKLNIQLIKTGLLLVAVIEVFVYSFAEKIAVWFGAEGSLIYSAAVLLRCCFLAVPFDVITSLIRTNYQCLGKIKLLTFLNFLSALVFPMGFIFATKAVLGIYSIWFLYLAGQICIILFILLIPVFRQKKFSLKINDLIMLDAIEGKQRLNLVIDKKHPYTDSSCSVIEFCKQMGIDDKRSYFSGLCIEEMARNISEYYSATTANNTVADILVFVDNNEVNIRYCGTGPCFDPISVSKEKDENDPFKNIGIRIVMKLAKELDYNQTFGANVISVKL